MEQFYVTRHVGVVATPPQHQYYHLPPRQLFVMMKSNRFRYLKRIMILMFGRELVYLPMRQLQFLMYIQRVRKFNYGLFPQYNAYWRCTITCNAIDAVSSCAAVATSVQTVLPSPTISASNPAICV
jgi:hypothetical protein